MPIPRTAPGNTGSRRARRAVLTAGAVAAASVALLAPATATSAAPVAQPAVACTSGNVWHFMVNGVRIRAAGNDTATILGLGYIGQHFCADTRVGDWVHGTNASTGVTGWSSVTVIG